MKAAWRCFPTKEQDAISVQEEVRVESEEESLRRRLRARLRDSRPARAFRRRRKTYISLLILFAQVLGALTSVHAIMSTRTSQGAIAWAVSLNTLPYVAVPAYWVFGRSKFQDYRMERQAAFDATNPVARLIKTQYLDAGLISQPERDSAFLLEKLARLPYTSFNQVDLLIDGKQTFGAIFDAIDRARDYVLVQYYIVRDDNLGRDLRDRMIARRKAGVRVYFLYDEIGSAGLPDSYVNALRTAGVEVAPFNTTKGTRNRFQLNFRNHRKIVVIDGREAFIGGLNVGDEYMGKSRKFSSWRDTHVRIVGPAVQFAQLSFTEDWHWATSIMPPLNWTPEKSTSGTQSVLCLSSGPADPHETCTLFYLDTINEARHRLWIATPYFVPDTQLMSALQLAAMRGVDVRIIVPRNNDSQIVRLAIFSFLEECERSGIKMLQYHDGFMHQKALIADDNISAVGTANFDNRSFRLNFEVTAIIRDRDFNAQMTQMLEDDMMKCTPLPAATVTRSSYAHRFLVRAARLFSPVL